MNYPQLKVWAIQRFVGRLRTTAGNTDSGEAATSASSCVSGTTSEQIRTAPLRRDLETHAASLPHPGQWTVFIRHQRDCLIPPILVLFLAADNIPKVQLHFTLTYSSWLNQVKLWFAKIQRDLLARGIFTSVADLARKIRKYIRAYAKVARPSVGPFPIPPAELVILSQGQFTSRLLKQAGDIVFSHA